MSSATIQPAIWRGTKQQKRAYAIQKSAENAAHLSNFLGFHVSENMPGVLLTAAAKMTQSIKTRKYFNDLCERGDHYTNCMKVLACAVLHYDLACNRIALRNKDTGKMDTCQNTIFNRLDMPPSTIDNCLHTLKQAGMYLSIERCEPKLVDNRWQKRAIASIKRINAAVFATFGLEKELVRQQQAAVDRRNRKTLTPCERMFRSYSRKNAELSEKRAATRARKKSLRAEALIANVAASLNTPTPPQHNATTMIMDLIAQGIAPDVARERVRQATQAPQDLTALLDDTLDDIPY